jgi:hypothetical protein
MGLLIASVSADNATSMKFNLLLSPHQPTLNMPTLKRNADVFFA